MGIIYPREHLTAITYPRVAIVADAAQGIGHRIAHQLADDGIDVAENDISAKAAQIDRILEEVQNKRRRALAVPADVTKRQEFGAMIEETAQVLGSVDTMVANV